MSEKTGHKTGNCFTPRYWETRERFVWEAQHSPWCPTSQSAGFKPSPCGQRPHLEVGIGMDSMAITAEPAGIHPTRRVPGPRHSPDILAGAASSRAPCSPRSQALPHKEALGFVVPSLWTHTTISSSVKSSSSSSSLKPQVRMSCFPRAPAMPCLWGTRYTENDEGGRGVQRSSRHLSFHFWSAKQVRRALTTPTMPSSSSRGE